MKSKRQYIPIDFYSFERKDEYSIGSRNEARASHHSDGNWLGMYLDNIWKDTQNFEDFVEGLNVIYLTEILCMKYKEGPHSHALCLYNNKSKNDCLFLLGAKRALKSKYRLFQYDYIDDEDDYDYDATDYNRTN